jgi:NADH:ubiquinone oxidoreductase subunit 5 (subunit L)/multisubunit Na+/H+ antiporter MnhA subunit
VYVLIRFNYLFNFLNFYLIKITFLITILVAGFCAVIENDLKKIVAISTLRQLGIIIFILSVGLWSLSFIHIIIHAFFKSILFLRTGSLIGQIEGVQDSRLYGNSFFSYSSLIFFITRCLSLSGFPFFIGFYSKDQIIRSNSLYSGLFYYYLFLIGCIFTVIYRIRLVNEAYLKSYKYFNIIKQEESKYFFVPVILLFFKCWLIGGIFYWFFLIRINFFILFLDLFVGIFLLTLGLLLNIFFKISYRNYFILASIIFIRWKRRGGSSFYIRKIRNFSQYEFTWIEILGRGGLFKSIEFKNVTISYIINIKLGILIMLVIYILIIYFL